MSHSMSQKIVSEEAVLVSRPSNNNYRTNVCESRYIIIELNNSFEETVTFLNEYIHQTEIGCR